MSLLDAREAAFLRWLRVWSPAAVSVGEKLRLDDVPTMVGLAQGLLDCLIRQILPLPQRYGRMPDGHPELAVLPPLVDAPSRRAAREALLRPPSPPLAFQSTAAALAELEKLATAQTLDEATEPWTSLFGPQHSFDMALHRAKHTGIEAEVIAARIAAVMTSYRSA